MRTSENYKRFAVRCLEEARNTTDGRNRAFLIEMAQAWQKLADQVATTESLQAAPVPDEPDRGD